MYVLNQVESDEAIAITASFIVVIVVVVSLIAMWLSERKQADSFRYERDSLFHSRMKNS